jgi:Hexapeptide repeat of succinyl-transferase
VFWRIRSALGLIRAPTREESTAARIALLRRSGMVVGERVGIVNCTLDSLFPFLIEIGSDVLMTHATVLAHDASPVVFGARTRVGRVRILDRCFIGAGAVILPGVTIGPRAIVGANAVVSRDVPEGCVVAGNPGQVVAKVDDWLARKEALGELVPWPGGIVPTDAQVTAGRASVRAKFQLGSPE